MVFLFYQVVDKLPSLSSFPSEGNKITRWYSTRKTCYERMFRNINPCYWVLHESEADNINLHTDGVNIEKLKSFKLFGVLLDSALKFSEHISSVCKKASQQIRVLRRLRKLIATHAKLQLYKAAILPHLTYCSTIWHFCRASNKRKVERLQERALRLVFNNDSVSVRLADCQQKASGNCDSYAVFMAKKNKLPSQIQELFMLKANRDKGYSLKNSDFNLPRFNKIKYGKHSLRYYGSFL